MDQWICKGQNRYFFEFILEKTSRNTSNKEVNSGVWLWFNTKTTIWVPSKDSHQFPVNDWSNLKAVIQSQSLNGSYVPKADGERKLSR